MAGDPMLPTLIPDGWSTPRVREQRAAKVIRLVESCGLVVIDPKDPEVLELAGRACNPRRWDAYVRDGGPTDPVVENYRAYARNILAALAGDPHG